MLDYPLIVKKLEKALDVAKVSTQKRDLEASSHDTWPLMTKLNLLDKHPNKADVVVRAQNDDDICQVLAIANEEKIPVTVRALASSVTGQPLPTKGGIVLDISEIPSSYSLNEQNMTVTATCSQNGGDLEDMLQKQGWTLGHSPQSLYRSTVGGWLATLATGQFSSLYGGIEDLVVGYDVILATGEKMTLKANPRAAMGPDLRQIFLGSEGTLGVITSVTLKVFPTMEAQAFMTYAIPTVEDGLALMREITASNLKPFLVRFYDTEEAKHAMQDKSFDTPVLFLGSRGLAAMVDAEQNVLHQLAEKHGGKAIGPEGTLGWMERRFDFSTVENLLATKGGFGETIEIAHNWDSIHSLWQDLKQALDPMANEVISHFSHIYNQGTSMYVILLGQEESDEAAVARLEQIWKTTMEVCIKHGAELSHHHGGGLARSPYSRRSIGEAHLILRKLKAALDPNAILNPGKLGLD
ncbi:FAD-binding oxidoreductase [Photobacterium sp. BZF1]|uniref:FAD-binding oxidoreductase n=1 Tax=Photobacterium sp. BZF1 TaxID=1904457 RepID=UPI001653D49E|nr:FAD-binding oxidoreductase [Photobacterium sp. BZF1]MBC7001277.1 FAD-binding oxidoreductase [Photobacterium sp. BZF1]